MRFCLRSLLLIAGVTPPLLAWTVFSARWVVSEFERSWPEARQGLVEQALAMIAVISIVTLGIALAQRASGST